MAEIPSIQAFSGDSWDQCSTLIHNVRNAAWKEGKIQDQTWMANFASIHFTGEALAWYACLPRDVQEDWPKLQVALANRWSTQKGEFPAFSGDSWDECSALVHNVRHAAWREGKIGDQAWMANFASIHFTGEALAWYARLPRDVQEDWPKLQAALANRWSTPDAAASEDVAGSEDVGAQDGKSESLARGLLKVIKNSSSTTFYMKGIVSPGVFGITQNVAEAARFRFVSQSTPTLLEHVVDVGRYQWFAINWNGSNPNLGRGSTDYGNVSTIDPETMKSSYSQSGLVQVVKFRLLSSGEVAPVWISGKTETDLAVFTNGSYFYFVPDPEACARNWSTWQRVTLYIQKIEE